MSRCVLGGVALCLVNIMFVQAALAADGVKNAVNQEQFRPKLLAELPDALNTPDGMRLDKKTGNIVLACPNFAEPKYPGKLVQITPDNRIVPYFDNCPAHPVTGRAHPMGLDFGPNGNLYYADNQYFNDKTKKHAWSRIIRVNVKDGRPVNAEVVVEGLKLANAVMFSGDNMFVTDTFFDLPGVIMGGVYRIPLADMQKGLVTLKPKGQTDPYLLTTSVVHPFAERGNDGSGPDGMTFDSKGNLYFGHFGDGQLFKVTFNADGSIKSKTRIAQRPTLTCCDGMFCDVRTDKIYITDSAKNAIQVVDTRNNNAVSTLWENGDTDGADGLLDQPCEPAIRGNDLIISNFDLPFPGVKNTKYDKPHTMSVIHLGRQ